MIAMASRRSADVAYTGDKTREELRAGLLARADMIERGFKTKVAAE